MHICPDPLEAVRSVGPKKQWCVTLPACYPTIIPYIPTNIEYNAQQASDTSDFSSDINNYACTNILDSSLCASSKLIQRIRRKIDLYETPSSNTGRHILQHLTSKTKHYVPNFASNEITDDDVRKRVNQRSPLQPNVQQVMSSTSTSDTSNSRSSSVSQETVDSENIDTSVVSKDSSYHSRSSDSSLHSTNLSTDSIQTNEDSSPFSPIQSLQSVSEVNKNNLETINSKHSKELKETIHSMTASSDDHDHSTRTVSTPDFGDRYLSDDQIISAIDLKSSSLFSPSHNQQRINRISSVKYIPSPAQSKASSISDFGQQEILKHSSISTYSRRSPSAASQYINQVQQTLIKSDENIDRNENKNDYQHRSSKMMRDDKVRKRYSWFETLKKKVSSKQLNTTYFHDSSPENILPMYINDQNRIDLDHLHIREAITALELDLVKEAYQAVIDKKKHFQQNRLMRILTAPSQCCRSCRTQRRLATVVQRLIDIALKNIQIPSPNRQT